MRRWLISILFAFLGPIAAFDISSTSNVVLYWGQDGGTLASVCQDPSSDVVVLAFLTTFFGTDGLPVINFAGSCTGPSFPGTDLSECDQIGQDIVTCQDAGKIVLLGLGGIVGDYGFSSSSEAETFATTLWNLFGEGTSSTRPFGSSIIDGFNLDIENKRPQFYSNFISASRSLFAIGSKQYYITGTPQCVFPDTSLGLALDNSIFDMIFVQFYNNPCCDADGRGFNYDIWQNWATSSLNTDVKIYVGLPGSIDAVRSGYISPSQLEIVITDVIGQKNFGGIMLWDAVQAFSNVQDGVNYAHVAKDILTGQTRNSTGSTSASVTTGTVVTGTASTGAVATKTVTTGTVNTGTAATGTFSSGTVATGAIVNGSLIPEPTTFQTVTNNYGTTRTSTETQTHAATVASMIHIQDPAFLELSIAWMDNLHNA